MFGGGEEYFREPPSIDRDTLCRFAIFCARLRAVEKPGKKTVTEAAALARDVGNNESAFDLVIGALFRHIKSWTGNKQLACWYILDKLCKEDRDKYGYTASKYILEVGRDYIPYEDPVLAPKYESLVEHWEGVFPRHVVDALWLAKKDRLWAVSHPDDVVQQQAEEEQQWRDAEAALEDADGLNDYGQPCMDYLQGRCFWGDACRLLHPPGEEGTLPMECRLGDWKCASCGVINRHFQRRCAACVREKPQYKKGRRPTPEEALLTSPDPAVGAALRRQFGYDPNDAAEAVAYWRAREADLPLDAHLAQRRAAFHARILRRPPRNPLEARAATQRHFPEVHAGPAENAENAETPLRYHSADTPPAAVGRAAQTVAERGARDVAVPRVMRELTDAMRRVAGDAAGEKLTATQAEALMRACHIVSAAWGADRETVPFVPVFFREVRHMATLLGLASEQAEQLIAMAKEFD